MKEDPISLADWDLQTPSPYAAKRYPDAIAECTGWDGCSPSTQPINVDDAKRIVGWLLRRLIDAAAPEDGEGPAVQVALDAINAHPYVSAFDVADEFDDWFEERRPKCPATGERASLKIER